MFMSTEPSLYTAVGDVSEIVIYRSPVATMESDLLSPVREYIADNRLVLTHSETVADDGMMFAEAQYEVYRPAA